jgi:putative glutamine amidotransferase
MFSSPLIGISSYARDGELPSFALPCCYVDAVRAAGGTAVILPPGEARPERLLEALDGLILSGGGDLDPGAYRGATHQTVYMVDGERDEFEMALARAALKCPRLPLLFICRGLQVLNVVCGGTLHAHIPDRYGDRVAHRLPPRLPSRHSVQIETRSALGSILGVGAAQACSWHHQSIDVLGADLCPTAWAEDGVVEAVEHTVHPWCIAVQWHPEMQAGEDPHARLFEALVVRAAREAP